MIKRQIIALGGGGFSVEAENPLLDEYVLQASGRARPKICFVPTASGDAEGYINKFHNLFKRHNCETSHLSLFKAPAHLEDFVLSQDILYVGGGNTRNLILLWREWGLDRAIEKAYERGIVLRIQFREILRL